jgi:drug/metabolite transporter (DMT)-like permease
VALAAFLLSEGIGPVQAAGGAAILAAAVILQRSPQRPVTVEGETTVALPSPGGP